MITLNKGRNVMAKLFNGVGAEIGVEQGVYSEIICQADPRTKLFCVDAWKTYSVYRDHTRQIKLDNFFAIAKKRLAPYGCNIIRAFSSDALLQFNDNSLDFVYIDANHRFDSVFFDIKEWTKRVKPGGIVAGHDYTSNENNNDVIAAVSTYCRKHKISYEVWLGDEIASWLFIKP